MSKKDEQRKAMELIYREAHSEAMVAAQRHIDANPTVWFPCGFAWVNIKPARGPFVNFLKEMKVGRTDDYYGGYTIWNPSDNSTQWMDAKEVGARAFAAVLKRYGINCTVDTRMD